MARRVKLRPIGMEPPSTDSARALVAQARRRFDLAIVVSQLRAPVWIAVLGAALFRVVFREQTMAVVGAVAGGLVTIGLVIGFVTGWRRRTTEREAAARVDRAAGAGGLLMTRFERPIGAWDATLEPALARVRPPEIAWRPIAGVWNAFVVLGLAMWVPLPAPTAAKPNVAAAGRIDDLKSQLDTLSEETGQESALEDALAELRRELEAGTFDAADWEATDALQAQLAQKAQDAESRLDAAARASQALEASLAEKGSEEERAKRQEALEQALNQLGPAKPGAPQGSTPGERARNAEQLRRELEAREDRLARAIADPSRAGGRRGERGRSEGQEKEGSGQADPTAEPGRAGGHSPGGEAGTVVFDGPDPEDPRRLEFKPLPPGEGEADQLWGMTAADPRRPAGAWRDAQGPLAASDGSPGHGAQGLLPRNRAGVQRYFHATGGKPHAR